MAKRPARAVSPRPPPGATASTVSPSSSAHASAQAHALEVRAHSGPLPAPEVLEGYERAAPGLAATIVAMAEREQAHRIAMEQRLAEAEIEADRRQLAIEERR